MRSGLVDDSLASALAELATTPRETWSQQLSTRFPDDPNLARQAMIWLHACDDELASPPSLGAGAERFELEVALGSGATASVWKAYDRKLRRHVAIKRFHDRASTTLPQSLAEARASSEVISEHVVRVHDVHDADPPYIVLELVSEHDRHRASTELGASAASCRPRDLTEAVRWVRDIARGVRDAHLHDVFHRDLKPHNVLITPISRRAKIVDFGLAVSAATTFSRAAIAGTPEYMAPEQARGLPRSLDARDPADRKTLVAIDVWGVGAIAYELLSGTPPWPRHDAVAAWEAAVSGTAPNPLEQTSAGNIVPKRLRSIVARAMALRPADRYASAEELARELDAFLERRPTSFDSSAVARFKLWIQRNPHLTATAAVALVLATMSLVAYGTVARLRTRGAELAADMRNAEAERQALALRVQAARRDLDDTEADLREQTASLAALRVALVSATSEYQASLAAQTLQLATATATTRRLSDQISDVRDNLGVADKARELYATFWRRAREEATKATTERDAARRERDALRLERDRIAKERDAARTARGRAERERDAAFAERDRERALEPEAPQGVDGSSAFASDILPTCCD